MIKDKNGETPLYGVVDERTKAIVYQGDAYTGRFMLFAVLLDVFLRGLNLNSHFIDANWDLMFIVIFGGLVSTAFQLKHKILNFRPLPRSFFYLCFILLLSAGAAFFISQTPLK